MHCCANKIKSRPTQQICPPAAVSRLIKEIRAPSACGQWRVGTRATSTSARFSVMDCGLEGRRWWPRQRDDGIVYISFVGRQRRRGWTISVGKGHETLTLEGAATAASTNPISHSYSKRNRNSGTSRHLCTSAWPFQFLLTFLQITDICSLCCGGCECTHTGKLSSSPGVVDFMELKSIKYIAPTITALMFSIMCWHLKIWVIIDELRAHTASTCIIKDVISHLAQSVDVRLGLLPLGSWSVDNYIYNMDAMH